MHKLSRIVKIRLALGRMMTYSHVGSIPASAPASVKNAVHTYNEARRTLHRLEDEEYTLAWHVAWVTLCKYLLTLKQGQS